MNKSVCRIEVVSAAGETRAMIWRGNEFVHYTKGRRGKEAAKKTRADAEAWCAARGCTWE